MVEPVGCPVWVCMWSDGEGAWLVLGRRCHQPGLLQPSQEGVCARWLLQDGILTWHGKVSDQERHGECQEGKWVKISQGKILLICTLLKSCICRD